MEQNKPILPTFFSDLKEAFRDKGGKIDLLEERNAFTLWQEASTGKKRSIVYAVKAGSFFRPHLDRLIADFPEAPAGNDGSIYTVINSTKTIKCEICGKEVPKDEACQVGENSGVFVCEECYEEECVKCDRCGDIIFNDDAHHTHYGNLCDCCYDDLFG